MPMLRPLAASVSLLSLLALAACTSETRIVRSEASTSGTEPVTDVTSFCGALCARRAECDTSLDVQTCRNACTNASAASFPRLRGEVVDLVVACFETRDCKAVLGEELTGDCAKEAAASVGPTAAATQACETLAAARAKCGRPGTKAACLEQAKLYADATLAEAENCASRACTEIDACVGASFGGVPSGTSTTTAPSSSSSATPSCAGRFSDLGSCRTCAEGACCVEAAACAADGSCRSAMATCQAASGASYEDCASMLNESLTDASRRLLGAYYACASSKCSTSCGFPSR